MPPNSEENASDYIITSKEQFDEFLEDSGGIGAFLFHKSPITFEDKKEIESFRSMTFEYNFPACTINVDMCVDIAKEWKITYVPAAVIKSGYRNEVRMYVESESDQGRVIVISKDGKDERVNGFISSLVAAELDAIEDGKRS